MKRTGILFVSVLLIASIVYAVVAGNNNDANLNEQTVSNNTETINDSLTSEGNTVEEASSEATSGLGYVEYSEQALADAANSKRLVFFHAPWCSTCNFFEGQIEEKGVPADVTILKVDFDNDTDTKKKYGVTVQSTFVLLNDNGEVERTWPFAQGLSSIEDLYSEI
jgi:thiol-disulfide isomerase/thioredoxin